MEKSTFSTDELNNLPKGAIVMLYLQMRESFTLLSEQNQAIQAQSATI